MSVSGNYSMILNGAENPIKVDFLSLKKSAVILRALNHKLRQQIVKIIDEKQKVTVTEIYIQLRLEQSVASQHLAILRRAGIVTTTRDGKYIYYTIDPKRIQQIMTCVESLIA